MTIDSNPVAPTFDEATNLTMTTATAIFVGSALTFSRAFFETLATEFADVRFTRLVTLDALPAVMKQNDDVGLVVIDEDIVESFLVQRHLTTAQARSIPVAIAYRDAVRMRTHMEAHSSDGHLVGVGYLPLNVQVDVWLSVMRLLLCGEVFYPQDLIAEAAAVSQEVGSVAQPSAKLTPREWEVLALAAQGKQNKVIAAEVCLTEHTVKHHMHNLLRKLGVSSRTGAANWYAAQRASQ